MDRAAAAVYLGGISLDALDRLGLPRVRIGRRVLFDRAELDRWVEDLKG